MKYGRLQPEGYITRIADKALSEMLDLFGAVEVAGTMWCGKTWTSLSFGESVFHTGAAAGRTAAESDPSVALIGDAPHVIDEWQDVPPIWDEVRAAVDAPSGGPGQFILTGSAQPRKGEVSHSGAGRIARLRMRTMSLAETGESNGRVSLSGLLEGRFEPVLVNQHLEPLSHIICRGGWPYLVQRDRMDAARFLDGYFDALFEVSIPKKRLNSSESRRVAFSLARGTGNANRLYTIANDAGFTEIDQKSATAKVAAHISALEELYVLDALRGWDAPVRSRSRVRIKPKYYFADPSLTAALLQITPERLLSDGNLFGVLFEALCIHDLSVYASALPQAKTTPLSYYHDSDGLEVDAILELRDGRWAAFEIKLGENGVDEAARTLNRLKRKVGANPIARHPEPEFLAVITGAGTVARYDEESGIYIIPITVLGP